LSQIPLNLYSDNLAKETLEALGHFKIEGQVIISVKYPDGLVLLV